MLNRIRENWELWMTMRGLAKISLYLCSTSHVSKYFPLLILFNIYNNYVLAYQVSFLCLSIMKINLAGGEIAKIRNQVM